MVEAVPKEKHYSNIISEDVMRCIPGLRLHPHKPGWLTCQHCRSKQQLLNCQGAPPPGAGDSPSHLPGLPLLPRTSPPRGQGSPSKSAHGSRLGFTQIPYFSSLTTKPPRTTLVIIEIQRFLSAPTGTPVHQQRGGSPRCKPRRSRRSRLPKLRWRL